MIGVIQKGAIRELNPGPPVPKTGIIPLDQSPLVMSSLLTSLYYLCDKAMPERLLTYQ